MNKKKPKIKKGYLFPIDEKERLEILKSYDSIQELFSEEFKEIAFLASEIFDCPISSISLVGEEFVVFKASIGNIIREVPRSSSFCTYTILSDEIFCIQDTLKDPRFSEIPATLERNIRFYIGAPLISPSGHRIGALCVLGYKPKRATKYQKVSLKFLAKYVVRTLEVRRIALIAKINHTQSMKDKKQIFLQEEKILQFERTLFCDVLSAQILNEVNKTLAVIYIKSIKVSSMINKSDFNKLVVANDMELLSETSFKTAKKINSFKSFCRDLSFNGIQFISVDKLIESVNLFFVDKIKDLNIQFNVSLEIDPKLEFECRPSDIIYVLLYLFNSSTNLLKHKQTKWIHIMLKEFQDSIEFNFADSTSRFERGLIDKDFDNIPR